jgi:hypothetical protein
MAKGSSCVFAHFCHLILICFKAYHLLLGGQINYATTIKIDFSSRRLPLNELITATKMINLLAVALDAIFYCVVAFTISRNMLFDCNILFKYLYLKSLTNSGHLNLGKKPYLG